jgi:hypothetical protein
VPFAGEAHRRRPAEVAVATEDQYAHCETPWVDRETPSGMQCATISGRFFARES